MRLTRKAPLATALLLCAACTLEPPPTAEPAPEPDACGAARFSALIGGPLAAFDPGLAPGPVRVIGPGQAVTMDYAPARLNVSHDRSRVITRIACG